MATGSTLAIFDALAARPTSASGAHVDLRNSHPILAFSDSADESADYAAVLPDHYEGGGLSVQITWAADTATTGDARWSVALELQPSGASFDLDSDDFGTASVATQATAAAAGRLSTVTLTPPVPTSPAPTAGDAYRLRISRVGTDVADTMVGDAHILSIEVREG